MRLTAPIPQSKFPPYDEGFENDTFAERLCSRLSTSKVLSLQLNTDADFALLYDNLQLFMEQDLQTATRAKSLVQPQRFTVPNSANDQAWFCISNTSLGDTNFAFDGLQSALTYVLAETLEDAHFPCQIEVSERRIRFHFEHTFSGLLWLDLRLASTGSPAYFPEQTRYASMLAGLAVTENPDETLVRRISALPGWGGIKLTSSNSSPHQMAHAPIPKEWRKVSREILRRMGVWNATSAEVEELVCAVLDFPSWNHLTATYDAAASSPHGLAMYCTWYSAGDSISFEQSHRTFEGALHSLVTAVQSTAKYSIGWDALEVACSLFHGTMTISAPSSPDGGSWELSWAFFLSPNNQPAELQERVRHYFDGRPLDEGTLADMFMCRQDSAQRSRLADSLVEMTGIAEVNSRRLYRQAAFPGHTGYRFIVHSLARDGSRLPAYRPNIYSSKVCLLHDPDTRYIVVAEKTQKGGFSVVTVLSAAEQVMASAIQLEVLPDIQKEGEVYYAGMSKVERKEWTKEIVGAARKAFSLT